MKPILFSTPMVQAILDGRKTMTRRIRKPLTLTPYKPGDILWVRETWYQHYDGSYAYRASAPENTGWKPSIFMPHEAARIFLRVTDVRAERVQDITEEDAKAEGCMPTILDGVVFISAKGEFHAIWDNLNAKRGFGWDANPWVWVISFEQISEQEAKEHDRFLGN